MLYERINVAINGADNFMGVNFICTCIVMLPGLILLYGGLVA